MRKNVREFVQVAAETLPFGEPILEIGCRPAVGQEEIADLHSFFPGARYIGSDYLPGANVDVLLDAHVLGIGDEQAGAIIMMDTLEHVQDPLVALRDVYRALRPGGIVIASSHMNFPIHNHPWDYWRYTPAAFDLIFRPFESRAVWSQGDPLAPRTVLAAACKGGAIDAQIAFDAATVALEQHWPEDAYEGPLIRFEPLLEALVRDSDHLGQEERTLPDLVSGISVEQTFLCPADNLARIDTKYTTNGRLNFCHLNLQLRDGTSGQVVAERRLFAQHLNDRVWVAFAFPAIADSAGRPYRLIISSWDGDQEAAVAPLHCDAAACDSEKLSVSGEDYPGTLCFRVLCRAPGYSPADYRRPSGITGSAVVQDAALRSADEAFLRRIAMTQSAQMWQVADRVDDHLERTAARIDRLESNVESRLQSIAYELENVLSFVQGLRSNVVYKAARRAGGLFRRRKAEG